MKMINTIQAPFFTAGAALPVPPRFAGSATIRPSTARAGRFDIDDAEGEMPELICRIILGLCLAFTLVECLLQLAAS